jgi:signal transduction histidine kinase
MISGIRGRLLLSYIILLVVTVGIIGVALLLILNTRPAPEQQTYQRLVVLALSADTQQAIIDAAEAASSSDELDNLDIEPLPFGNGDPSNTPRFIRATLELISRTLTNLAESVDTRIIVANMTDRVIIYDSSGALPVGQPFVGDVQSYSIPLELQRRRYGASSAVAGRFIQAGQEWLFVGVDVLGLRGDTFTIAFTEPRPTQSLQDALTEFGTEILPLLAQASLVGLLIAVILAVLITRSIAAPLQRVAKSATEVADGQLNVRVPVSGVKEVRDVAEAFNRLVDDVQGEQRSQQDFLANVSHDLKTPLTSIQGYSQAIIDGAAPDTVKAARIIYDEAARLNRMVIELTDLARLQAGRLSMHMVAIDMGQLAGAIAGRLAIVAQDKGITLTLNTPSMPPIAGDGDRLAQVMDNLISNAIKFTPSGGEVIVRTGLHNGGVEVSVQDSGIGISPGDLPRIFERFYQVDKARGPRRGTGLGLAIAQEIVQAHGGTITADSAGVKQGATFTVWLPSPQVGTVMRRR